MKRDLYYNYIQERLTTLCTMINTNGKLNMLGLHNHSENFYRDFCNKLYGWNLDNLNTKQQNVEAIDLIDNSSKLIVQVSATNTKQKIESSLKKEIIKKYPSYTFKFIAISKEADKLRKETYINPNGITFNPLTDILDSTSILNSILGLDIESQERIYKFIKKELGRDVDVVKLDSNLARIIDILSKENWDIGKQPIDVNSFEIERKISFNNLITAKYIITDYSAHYMRVDKIYAEFDTQGVNKSSSVLATIRSIYVKNLAAKSDDELFFHVIDSVQQKIINSTNYVQIPIDELELCVNILVVDTFIRCKIFKNPEKYKYANS